MLERGASLRQRFLKRLKIHLRQSQIALHGVVTILVSQVAGKHSLLTFKALVQRLNKQLLPLNGDLLHANPRLRLLNLSVVGPGVQGNDGVAFGDIVRLFNVQFDDLTDDLRAQQDLFAKSEGAGSQDRTPDQFGFNFLDIDLFGVHCPGDFCN